MTENAVLQYGLLSSEENSSSDSIHHVLNGINHTMNITQKSPFSNTSINSIVSDEVDRLEADKQYIISKEIEKIMKNFMHIQKREIYQQNVLKKSKKKHNKSVLNAIEARRLHMVERATFIISYKLHNKFTFVCLLFYCEIILSFYLIYFFQIHQQTFYVVLFFSYISMFLEVFKNLSYNPSDFNTYMVTYMYNLENN